MPRSYQSPPNIQSRFSNDPAVLAAELEEEKTAAELDLLSIILSDPAGGIAAAAAAGIGPREIDADDLRIMFKAADAAAALGIDRPLLLRVLRRWLIEAGHWQPKETRSFHRGSIWGDECFAEFADSFSPFPCPGIAGRAIAEVAAELLDLRQRLADAADFMGFALARLEGRAA